MTNHKSKLKITEILSPEAQEEFAQICAEKKYQTDEIVYFPGEEEGKIYFIEKGEVQLYRTQDGKKIVIQVLRGGDFFGDLSFTQHPYPLKAENYARASHQVKLCQMSTDDLLDFLKKHPDFSLLLLINLRNRIHQAESKIKDLAISSAQIRVINELVRFAVEHGDRQGDYYVLEDKLTHKDLADMTGITRETVTKTIQLLKDLEFMEYTDDKMIRINFEKIKTECIECLTPSEAEV